MAEQDWLAGQFEQNRQHLQAVAYSMLGTLSEAQDAVQEAWLRLGRSDPGGIGDLRGWLTTVVGRISLDMLRARKARREVYPGSWLPEPLVEDSADNGPEQEAVLADSVGMALLVVLESLTPAERLSFVLHDVFAVPFDDVARIMDRTPDSARQLASRARRRVQAAPQPDRDVALQRRVVDAFLAAARGGDFEALLQVLDPAEADLPYSGRIRFRGLEREADTLIPRVEGVRDEYGRRLKAQQDGLAAICSAAGFSFAIHRTDHSPEAALLGLYTALTAR